MTDKMTRDEVLALISDEVSAHRPDLCPFTNVYAAVSALFDEVEALRELLAADDEYDEAWDKGDGVDRLNAAIKRRKSALVRAKEMQNARL